MNPDSTSLIIAEAVSRSDVGRVRVRNEDVTLIDPGFRWAIVADGMGGYYGGDVAARIGADVSNAFLNRAYGGGSWAVSDASRALLTAVEEANGAVYRAGAEAPELVNMGSTLLLVALVCDRLISAHVGDSRLYRFRCGELSRLTRDHTLLQQYIDDGVLSEEEVRLSGVRGVLTQALGVYESVEPEVGVHEVACDDLLLMCSDGLTDMLPEQDIAAMLAGDTLSCVADALIAAANMQGGRDNVSVILMRVGPAE